MKQHILLVEDEKNFGAVLKDYLQLNGFAVTLCEDGIKGLEIFQNNSFDLCILDVMMPKKDGFTLAEEIRQMNKNIPVLFLTAKSLR
jgi:DNA-binding response OmpR family regulator